MKASFASSTAVLGRQGHAQPKRMKIRVAEQDNDPEDQYHLVHGVIGISTFVL
jgi:hypothetical protein